MSSQDTDLLEDALSLVRPLSIARLQLELEVLDPLYLPRFAGNTFRGGLGSAFFSISCPEAKPNCESCEARCSCPYGQVFAPLAPQDAPERYREAPRPFALDPPEGGFQLQVGEIIRMGLSMFGGGIPYLPFLLVAIQKLGQTGIGPNRGRFELRTVAAVGDGGVQPAHRYDGAGVPGDLPPLLTGERIAEEAAEKRWSALRVSFISPTRVKLGGRLAPALEFHGLVAALIHRLFPMVLCHCGASPDPASCQRLIEAARGVQHAECSIRWEQRSRRSARQGREIPMDGFVGDVTYRGDLAPFMPLLVAGTYVGVGKGTVFGNGRYRLAPA